MYYRIGSAGLLAALLWGGVAAAAPDSSGSQKDGKKDQEVVSVKPRTRVILGGVSVGAGYARYSGPYYGYPYYFSPYYGPGWWPYYSSWWGPYYSPMFHPGFYNGFRSGPNMGEVRLHAAEPDAEVYLDGAYAGKAHDLKNMWLEPGRYNLEIRSGGQTEFSRKIYVLSGKSIRLDTSGTPEHTEKKP